MTRVLVCVALAGCFTSTLKYATFVRDARVEGYTLVVEKCQLSAHDDSLVIGDCHADEQRIPVLVVQPAAPVPAPKPPLMAPVDAGPAAVSALPDRPDAADLARALAPARHQLADCAAASRLTAVTRVHVTIDPAGKAIAVSPDAGDAGFTSCLERALGAIAFPPSRQGAKIVVAVQAAP